MRVLRLLPIIVKFIRWGKLLTSHKEYNVGLIHTGKPKQWNIITDSILDHEDQGNK